jgi:hypothetical protein
LQLSCRKDKADVFNVVKFFECDVSHTFYAGLDLPDINVGVQANTTLIGNGNLGGNLTFAILTPATHRPSVTTVVLRRSHLSTVAGTLGTPTSVFRLTPRRSAMATQAAI